MKSSIQFLFFAFILLCFQNSFSVPLNGQYTIGGGGNYPDIHSAVQAVDSLGISGPVTFRILTGTYNEFNTIGPITGTSLTNTVTFESFTGNSNDVIISFSGNVFRIAGASHLIIRNLTLGNIQLTGQCQRITISNNKFTNKAITQLDDQSIRLRIENNTGMSGITLASSIYTHERLMISNNVFNSPLGYLNVSNADTAQIEGNTVNNLSVSSSLAIIVRKNKVEFFGLSLGGFEIRSCTDGQIYNNFTTDNTHVYNVLFQNNILCSVLNNTFLSVGPNLDTTVSILDNDFFYFTSNIVTNSSHNYVLTFNNNDNLALNWNTYYNGIDTKLIKYNGINYDNLAAFSAATGYDLSSTVTAVDFVSESDLHLEGNSIGDSLLTGVPDPRVTEDIDGQPRNGVYPYKGADEADIPLPVELASFNSLVQNNNVLLNWVTSSEQNNFGFDIERSAINNDLHENWIRVGFVKGKGIQPVPYNYSFNDNSLMTGNYRYRLKQIDFNGNYKYYNLANEVVIGIPDKFDLSQNYPNPFNPNTKINFDLPFDAKVVLKIFDIAGKEIQTIVNENKPAGYYTTDFNAAHLSSGVYFYRILADGVNERFEAVKKMMLVK